MTTRRILVGSLLALLHGCAGIDAIPEKPATPPGATTLPAAPAPPAAAPAPSVTPAAAPAAPAPRTGAAPPRVPLRPELSAEEEQRLLEAARQNIGDVERLLGELAGRLMKPPQQEAFRTAKNFLDQARNALGQRDYQRAANLASKARALTDDLAGTTR